MNESKYRLVMLTAPEGESEAEFYHRKFRESLLRERNLKVVISNLSDALAEAETENVRLHEELNG
jgi:hypothetical protein